MDSDESRLRRISEIIEELGYRLTKMVKTKELTPYQRTVILENLLLVFEKIVVNYNNIKEELEDMRKIKIIKSEYQIAYERAEEANRQMEVLNKEIESKTKDLENTKKEIEDKKKDLENKKKELEDKEKEIENKDKEIENKDKEIENKDKEIENKDKEINKLKELLKKYNIAAF